MLILRYSMYGSVVHRGIKNVDVGITLSIIEPIAVFFIQENNVRMVVIDLLYEPVSIYGSLLLKP